jgi:hypothetical protein
VSKNKERLSASMKSYRQRKISLGYCTYGGCWELTGGSILCPAHADRKNELRRARALHRRS